MSIKHNAKMQSDKTSLSERQAAQYIYISGMHTPRISYVTCG
jgi:hypothetical protein